MLVINAIYIVTYMFASVISSGNDRSFTDPGKIALIMEAKTIEASTKHNTDHLITPSSLPILVNELIALSRCSSVCAALNCTLILARPLATTG